jgi:hypothetical protein
MDKNNILEVRNLHTWFHTDEGIVKAVDDVILWSPNPPRMHCGRIGQRQIGHGAQHPESHEKARQIEAAKSISCAKTERCLTLRS